MILQEGLIIGGSTAETPVNGQLSDRAQATASEWCLLTGGYKYSSVCVWLGHLV